MARPIAVERAKSPLPLDHFLPRRHHGARRFLLHPLGVVGFVRRVVQHLDQVIPAIVPEPLVVAAVQVQQHPRQGPGLAPLAMHPALARLLHQPRALQRELHPGVAQLDAVLFPPSRSAGCRTLKS